MPRPAPPAAPPPRTGTSSTSGRCSARTPSSACSTRLLRRAGQPALRLREDFSGTALLSASWVAGGPGRTAVAVDLDPAVPPLGRAPPAPGAGRRRRAGSRLVQADVRHAPRGPFDAILALNFSYQVFQAAGRRCAAYLAAARRALAPGGLFMLDLFGGWLAQQEVTERRRIGGGVTYVWEHDACDPITHRIRCAIHFELPGRAAPAPRLHLRLAALVAPGAARPARGGRLRPASRCSGTWSRPASSRATCPGATPPTRVAWLAYLVGRRPGRTAR